MLDFDLGYNFMVCSTVDKSSNVQGVYNYIFKVQYQNQQMDRLAKLIDFKKNVQKAKRGNETEQDPLHNPPIPEHV